MKTKIESKFEDTVDVAVKIADNTMQTVKEGFSTAMDKVVDVKDMLVGTVENLLGFGKADEKKEE